MIKAVVAVWCALSLVSLGALAVAAKEPAESQAAQTGTVDVRARDAANDVRIPDESAWPLARRAVGEDPAAAEHAISQLRALGPAGLEALLSLLPQAPSTTDGEAVARIEAAIDGVAAQRDASVSRLYWYTDFDAAQAAAAAVGKPILSLRLLGNLTDDMSCANSRFFRTTLYANQEVARYLRDHFVLHWKSVRPVPKITVDLGDGHRIERTLTGNSIHYVLDARGRVVDALPGLYGQKAFLRALGAAEAAAQETVSLADDQRLAHLRAFHAQQSAGLAKALAEDLEHAGVRRGTAYLWARNTTGKDVPDDVWARIAARHLDDAALDAASQGMIARDAPRAIGAGKLALTKSRVENPLLRVVATVRRSIAEDTVRNEYTLHQTIHDLLSGEELPLDDFNRVVYAKLFLTPLDDPWMGLVPDVDYAALPQNGLIVGDGPLAQK